MSKTLLMLAVLASVLPGCAPVYYGGSGGSYYGGRRAYLDEIDEKLERIENELNWSWYDRQLDIMSRDYSDE